MINTAKKEYFLGVIQANKNSGTTRWKVVNQITGQLRENQLVTKIGKLNNVVITKTKKIAEKFNGHFSRTGK